MTAVKTIGRWLTVAVTAGFDAVSLPRIATCAGVSVGLAQRYFASEDDLLAYAVEELFGRLRDRARLTAAPGPVRDQLLAALTTLLPLDDQRMAAHLLGALLI